MLWKQYSLTFSIDRGRGNQSNTPRYVGYFSYRRPWFEPSTHFEATRSLYDGEDDIVTKGQHNENETEHNETEHNEDEHEDESEFDLGLAVRHEFPAIDDHVNNIFADGAGGSQVHQNVISAVATHMRYGAANLGVLCFFQKKMIVLLKSLDHEIYLYIHVNLNI